MGVLFFVNNGVSVAKLVSTSSARGEVGGRGRENLEYNNTFLKWQILAKSIQKLEGWSRNWLKEHRHPNAVTFKPQFAYLIIHQLVRFQLC